MERAREEGEKCERERERERGCVCACAFALGILLNPCAHTNMRVRTYVCARTCAHSFVRMKAAQGGGVGCAVKSGAAG